MMYLKVLLFVAVFVWIFALLLYFKKTSVISRTLKNVYNTIDKTSVERARKEKKSVGDIDSPKKGVEKLLETPNRLFVYSGLGRKIPGLTIEIWMVCTAIIAAIVYFLVFFIQKDAIKGLLTVASFLIVVHLVEVYMAHKNYKIIDNCLLQFLNQLGNFSIVSGEITSVFHQVSRFMPSPLNDVLEECYYEAQTSGDVSEALYAAASKIEHPKFKEIITNIEVCTSYTSNFKVVVNSMRQNLQNENKSKQDRKSMASEALINILILSLMILIAFVIVDNMVDVSIWFTLMHTVVGNVSLIIIGISYAVFLWNVAIAER